MNFAFTKKIYLAFVFSIIGFVANAQCIGPYQTFESFKTVPVGWTLNSGVTSFTSAPNALSRSGANLLQQTGSNTSLNTTTLNYPAVISPAIPNPKEVSFFINRNAASGVVLPYDFQYSPDNGVSWYTIPDGLNNIVNGVDITGTIPTLSTPAGPTGWNQVKAVFNVSNPSVSYKFRIRDLRSKGTFDALANKWTGTPGSLWLDDFSVITYNATPDDNLIVVPELGASTSCSAVTIPPVGVYKFYDQGGLNDNYNKSQTQIMIFKPQNGTDKVRVTFVNSFALDANSNITVYNGNGAVVGNELLNAYTSINTLPGASQSPINSYISTNPGDYLTIKIVTLATTPLAGFDINVECPGSLAITSLSGSGCLGTPLLINGSGFTGTTAVSVGGTPVTSYTVTNSGLITAYPAAASSGTVVVTNGGTATSAATYTVKSLPTATASSTGSTCAGNLLSLIGGASGGSGSGYTYSWSGPSSFTNATQSPLVSATATTAMTGTYSLTVTDGNSCSSTAATTAITISAGPSTSTNGGNQSACKGTTSPALGGNVPVTGTGVWTCTAAPGGGSTSDITFTSASTANTTAIVATGAVTGAYTLTWTISSPGCTSSASSLTLTVNAPSTFTATSLSSQSLCQNATPANLSVTASGTITTYQWYSNTTASTSGGTTVGTNSNIYTPITTAIGNLYYYCLATNSTGCIATSIVSGAISVANLPVAPVLSAATSIGGSAFTANWATVSGATGYLLDVSTVSNFASFVPGYSGLPLGNVTSYGVSGLSQGTTYYYRVRATNGCGISANPASPISLTTLTLTYCAPTYSFGDSLGDEITNVTLGTLSNTTGVSSSPFYTFYNAVTVPNVYKGGTANISVTFGSHSRQYLGVWIDFNQNGTFEASEGVVTTNSAGSNGTSTLTITVPAGALLGNTRMRVRGGDDSAMTTAMACGATNSTFGETEDYIVNIITVPPCSPNLPTALTASFITATSAVLSWSDALNTPNSIYEFAYNQLGTTPTSGTLLPMATSTNLSGLTLGLTYYCWVRSNCGATQSAWVGPISFTTISLDVVNLDSSTNGSLTSTCNAKFYDSGSATGEYSNGESYTHTFKPASGGSKLKAVFNSFSLENNFDYLSVYSGPTAAAANLIGRYTGTQISAGQAFYSTATNGELTFVFTSDGSVTRSGWDVSLTCVIMPSITSFDITSACSGATPVITITGLNLGTVNSVSFNGVLATPTATTATTVTVTLPATATTGFVTVSTPTATAVSATQFVVKPLPATPSAGSDVAICAGGSTTLNATGTIVSQVIVQNTCNNLSAWTTNDTSRWLVSSTNTAGGTSGELDFHWSPSGVTTGSYIYLNQIINTSGYTALNLSFKNKINWFTGSFDLYVETSPDLVTWTQRWTVAPVATSVASTVNVNLAALNGTSFYIRFRFAGNSFNIDDWFIDDVTLSGIPTLTYTWAANASLSSTAIYNPVVTPTTTQTYTVNSSYNGCSSALGDDVVVTINPRPTAIITGTQAVCNGNTATLSVALTGTAPWTITYTNGTTPVTATNILTSPYVITTPAITSTKTYTVTALSDSKCSATAGDLTGNAVITISAPPTITPSASATGVCYSNSSQTTTLNYSATTVGTGGTYSIVWNSTPSVGSYTVTDAVFPNTSSGSVSVTVPGLLNNGVNNAFIVVKNSSGCVSASTAFTVTILPSPTVTMTASTQIVCYSGSTQTVTFPYNNANTLNSYDLVWDATPSNGLASVSNVSFTSNPGNIVVTVPAGTAGGTYHGVVTPRNSSCGIGAVSRDIYLTVSAPSITPAASATAVCFSASAQTTPLTYSAVTGTTYSIVWNASPTHSFATVTDAAIVSSPITIAVPAGTAAATYTGTISVKNAGCVSTGIPFTVQVSGKPVMVSSFVLEPLCPSSSVQSAVLNYTTVSNTPTSYSIVWNATANAAGLANQGITPYTFSSSSINTIVVPGNLPFNQYFGTLTIANAGCTNSYPITLNVGKKWNGSTDSNWATASNWIPSGEPTSTDCVYVPLGTPYSPIIVSNATTGSLTVNSGAVVTVNSGYTLFVKDVVNTDGTLTINDDASLVQDSDVPNTGSGSMIYKRDVTNLDGYDYIYWSSPVGSQSLAGLYTSPTMGSKYYWDTLVDNGNGGTSGNISQGNWAQASGNMEVGKGYIVRASNDYGWTGNLTSTFTGIPNNGTKQLPLHRGSYNGGDYPGLSGLITAKDDDYNLIGNPYPSAIDAISFLTLPSNASKIDGYVSLWTHGITPSAAYTNPFYSSYGMNYSPDDYIVYNNTGGTSGPTGFNGKIAGGQGFFVTMLSGGLVSDSSQLVTFNNSMRSSANSQFYKSSQVEATQTAYERHRIWIDLIDSSNNSTRTLVGYATGATNGKDRMYDAFTKVAETNVIYSRSEGENLAIQGRALPFDENDQVAIGFNASATGNFTIAIAAVDGLFEQGQPIYLEDKLLNIIYDLRQAPYNFNAVAGAFNDRFVLRYTSSALSVNQFNFASVAATIVDGQLQIKANTAIDSVQVFDITGKLVKVYNPTQKTTDLKEDFSFEKGVYFAKIKLIGGDLVTQKIMN